MRLSLLVRAVGLALVCTLSVGKAHAQQPLNIVVLYADDWRHDTLGCAGHPIVKTPNIDRLAKDGIRFTHNYVTTSICGVSRASLLTGQWMSRHGNRAFNAFDTPWDETYPGMLRANGYHVGHIGKWHNGKFPAESFDVGLSYAGTYWMKGPLGDPIHVTKKNERDALQFLRQRPQGKPFCLTLAFFATHAEDANPKQYLPQPSSMSLYRDETVPTPVNGSDEDFKKLPKFIAQEKNEGRVRWHWRFDTPDRYQDYMKNYLRLATEVDDVCGKVIEELQQQGVLERTMVIFTTDNGYFHGEHGLADKWYPYEESIRVPLVVWDPRIEISLRGASREEMTLNVDLAPTILAAAQLAPPSTMQGRDLSTIYRTKTPPVDWRTEFFYEHATISSVERIPSSEALVRKDIKYIYWPDYQLEQLFDLAADPNENQDLSSDPSRADQLRQLRLRFAELKSAAR
jgi:arylsulfatase A-like enzyme